MKNLVTKFCNADKDEQVIGGFIALILIFAVVACFYAVKAQGQWNDWCEGQGGIVDSTSKTGIGTGLSANGTPVTTTTTTTTYYCIVDGKIVDVQ